MVQHVAESVTEWIAKSVNVPVLSGWITVTQDMIAAFADTTRDWNFLHVDEDAARKAGMERTIAHGFLTLALISPLRMEAGLWSPPGMQSAMNYGMDRLRFLSPVHAGDRIRARFTVTEIVEARPGQYRESVDVAVEIEGGERPALVATWIVLYLL